MAALAAYPCVAIGPQWRGLLALVAAAAVLLLAAGLVLAWTAGIPWALGLVGAEVLAGTYTGHLPLLAVPLFGAGLLLVSELAYGSIELRRPAARDRAVVSQRARSMAILPLAGLVLAAILEVAGGVPLAGSLVLVLVAVLAAGLALATLAALAWRGQRI